jgi:hypothetical protein
MPNEGVILNLDILNDQGSGGQKISLLIIENLSNRLVIVQYLHTTNKDLKIFHQCKPMCHLSLGH